MLSSSTERNAPCLDCPAVRAGVCRSLVTRQQGCAFRSKRLGAREELPASWFNEYALALVRRGFIAHGPLEGEGELLTIDLVGAGGAMSLHENPPAGGYAATEALVCLLPRQELSSPRDSTMLHELWIAQGRELARVSGFSAVRAHGSARSRVGALLRTLFEMLEGRTISSALRQTTLASLAGIRRESFCRELSHWIASGAVQIDSNGIHLVSPRALFR